MALFSNWILLWNNYIFYCIHYYSFFNYYLLLTCLFIHSYPFIIIKIHKVKFSPVRIWAEFIIMSINDLFVQRDPSSSDPWWAFWDCLMRLNLHASPKPCFRYNLQSVIPVKCAFFSALILRFAQYHVPALLMLEYRVWRVQEGFIY